MRLGYLLFLFFTVCVFSACASPRYVSSDAYDLAHGAYERQHYDQAREFYKKFANENQDHPMCPTALYYWADSARECGRLKEAENVYQRLINKYQNGFWVDLAKENLKEVQYVNQ